MKSDKQVIKIVCNKGIIRMKGNGDMYTWQLASGIIHRREMAPLKRDKVKKFFRCLIRAIKWDAHEKAQKINKVMVGTEEAVTEFYPFSGFLN